MHVATAFMGALQVFPQAPQFLMSAPVGMQAPLHLVKPGLHWVSHWLATQTAEPFAGVGHAVPQPPQFAGLVAVSTHAPPQGTSLPPQVALHEPAEQTSVAPQRVTHPPQWDGSVMVSTQALPHRTKPALQTKSHPLPLHTGEPFAGALQDVLQLPQCAGSVVVSTHPPPHGERPASQEIPHVLAAHVACPLAGTGHTWVQLPQRSGSVLVSTQEAPHAVRPPMQLFAQPFGPHTSPTAQVVSHAPQLFGSLASSTHCPRHGENPASHAISHPVFVQTGEP
jgi:hypothetical protein